MEKKFRILIPAIFSDGESKLHVLLAQTGYFRNIDWNPGSGTRIEMNTIMQIISNPLSSLHINLFPKLMLVGAGAIYR